MRKGVLIAFTLSAVSILLLIAARPSPAGTIKDLGTAGTVYSIIEPDLLAELRQYARTRTPSPEMQQQERAHYQPKDLRRLPKATADRSFEVDMTYTLTHEVTDGSGHVLYPRGFKVNPLQYVNFTGGLVVIDGSDPRQVEWFEKSPYYPNKLAMVFLSSAAATCINPESLLTTTSTKDIKSTASSNEVRPVKFRHAPETALLISAAASLSLLEPNSQTCQPWAIFCCATSA